MANTLYMALWEFVEKWEYWYLFESAVIQGHVIQWVVSDSYSIQSSPQEFLENVRLFVVMTHENDYKVNTVDGWLYGVDGRTTVTVTLLPDEYWQSHIGKANKLRELFGDKTK